MIILKTLLIFPPHWSVSHPYLSLACLSAYLNERNIETDIMDLNAKCMNKVLSKEFMEKCIYRIELNENSIASLLGDKYEQLLLMGKSVINNIENAVEIMKREKNFFNIEDYVYAKKVIRYACYIVSQAYYPLEYKVGSLKYKEDLCLDNIKEFLVDEKSNLYLDLFPQLISEEKISQYNHIAISLIGFQQVLPVFTLCKLIKAINPSIKITIGGSVFSKLFDGLTDEEFKVLFELFDYIVTFEGEEHLYKLILAIDNKCNLQDVCNLIYYNKHEEKVVINKINKLKLDINKLPAPDFSKYNMKDYLVPKIVLPYYLSRSCYWGKCSFCDHDYGYDGNFRCKKMDKIIEDIKIYKDKYNADILHLVDEAIHPKTLEKFCDELLDKQIDISWFCYIRASKEFSTVLCNKMKSAGCLHIMVGIESCSDKVLNDMNKGNSKDEIKYTLENLHNAGIWSHVFLINNFPTETAESRLETMLFILNNIEICHSIGMGDFSLLKKSKVVKDLKKFGITNVLNTSSFTTELKYKSKLKNENLDHITADINGIYDKFSKTNYFLNRIILYREHLPVYLSQYNFIKDAKEMNKIFCKIHVKA